MPVLIFVCDDEQLAAELGQALLSATGHRSQHEPLRQQHELRSLAEAVCLVMNVAPTGTVLVPLLGGNPGSSNLSAVTRWCEATLPQLDVVSGTDLVDALASRLHTHLVSKMH